VCGTFRLVGVRPAVREVLSLSKLDSVLSFYDSLEAAKRRTLPWPEVRLMAAAVALAVALAVFGQLHSDFAGSPPGPGVGPTPLPPGTSGSPAPLPRFGFAHAINEVLALVAAALIGFTVTAVHKRQQRERPMPRSMEQAQILLCVSGAMIMVIIGDSLARAFGIAGAAGIIRFRTPVEDPKDVTILFLLMGLGMACGMGAFSVAGLATLFLCTALLVLDRAVSTRPRTMLVEIAALGREFPVSHVVGVFAQHGIVAEPREVALGDNAVITYHTTLPLGASIEDINASLVGDGSHEVKSVVWEAPKKNL
jgi:hypothetical protein